MVQDDLHDVLSSPLARMTKSFVLCAFFFFFITTIDEGEDGFQLVGSNL